MNYYKQKTITRKQFKTTWWFGVLVGALLFSVMGYIQNQFLDTPLIEGLKLAGIVTLSWMIGWGSGILTKVERRSLE
jgi:hypothetical protein